MRVIISTGNVPKSSNLKSENFGTGVHSVRRGRKTSRRDHPVAEAAGYQTFFIRKDGGNETTLTVSADAVSAGTLAEIPSIHFDTPGTVEVSVQATASATVCAHLATDQQLSELTIEAEILEIENLMAELSDDGQTVKLTWTSLGSGVTYEVTGMDASAITIDDANASAKIDTAAVTGCRRDREGCFNSSLQTGVGGEASLTLSRLVAAEGSSAEYASFVVGMRVAAADH